MKSSARPLGVSPVVYLCLLLCPPCLAQVNVTTYHNDNARTGQNTQETVLTASNVKAGSFGKLFSVALDGQVYAQPLVLTNVSIGGGTHNVVYVATENDSVYAIDANNGKVYWQKSLLNGGAPIPDSFPTSTGNTWNTNIDPQYGITGTPVIDPTTNTMYVVASTDESGVAYDRLYALDVTTGAENLNVGGPVVISGAWGGFSFNAANSFNRAGLLLQSGHVIIAFSRPCDSCNINGWIFSYNASTLAEEAAYSTDPGDTSGGSIWMSGDGVAADPGGNVYFAAGNGLYNGTYEYGDTIMKLGLPSNGAFSILDWFTPNIQEDEYDYDWDQGSGGVLILPDLTGVTYPHVLVQAGKTGTIYLVNRDGMGKWCNTIDGGSDTCTDQDVEEILGSACGSDGHPPCGSSANLAGIWGSPAYWNGNVYFPSAQKESDLGGSVADYMKTYSFNAGGSGVLSSQPTSHTPEKFNWPGPNPTVSSNGTSNGIVWTVDASSYASSCCEVLYAYDATNLNNELFNTNQSGCGPVNNNQLGGAIKFSVPTAANGKVYVADASELNVFGLYSLSTTASVSPTSLTLRSQYNNPAYGTASVTNDGPGELCFSSISVSGDYMSLYSTTCGALSPGSSCVATVEYNPGGCYAIVNGELDFYDGTLPAAGRVSASRGKPRNARLSRALERSPDRAV